MSKYYTVQRARSSATTEEPRDAFSVEILSTAAHVHEKSHLKRLAIGK